MKNLFGDAFTELRIESGFSLRKFCKEFDLDAGNWSRVERGLSNPPTKVDFYDKLVKVFAINEETKSKLYSMAQSVKILPKALRETELMEHMPVMLRKINGQPLNDEEVDKLVSWIKDTTSAENE